MAIASRHGMTWRSPILAFAAGTAATTLTILVLGLARPAPDEIPRAGVLHGWTVVRDDETLICESPSIFVLARQIECP